MPRGEWGQWGAAPAGPAASALARVFSSPAPDLAQLRKKFEEDKQRIELMRAQRKFRPY